MIDVLILEPNKQPYTKTIANDLKSCQEIVGGYIEAVTLKDGSIMIVNEDGKIMGLPFCRDLNVIGHNDFIVGNAFICNGNDEGDFTSLEESQIELYTKIFGI